ncbi:MAG: hypothetical protein WBB85_01675 [Albidovulum sp.]|uniref:hypothetical protein n=1 Tax=Albidovulum sp. TaxID=1872424 RepID=UPI003C883CC5
MSSIPIASAAAAILWLSAAATPAHAQALEGQLMQPSQPAPIRDAPPSGFWRTPGNEMGKTAVGAEYLILDQFDVQSGVGASQTWIQIAPVDPVTGSVDPAAAGWVYFGETENSLSRNFETSQTPMTRSLNFEPGEAVTTRSLSVTTETAPTAGAAPTGTRSIIILSPEGN